MDTQSIVTLAIIVGIGLAAVGPGIGMGIATAAAINAIARQPEVEAKATKMLLFGIVFMEVLVIYAIFAVFLAKYLFKLF